MTTQIEQIEWHKYPEENPDKYGAYLIQTIDNDFELNNYCYTGWEFAGEVIAWAEMPHGWSE